MKTATMIAAALVTSKPLPDSLQLDGTLLTVKQPDGQPLEIKKPFARGGLADVFGGTS